MLAAHRRRRAVAEALAHDLHGFFQKLKATPRGGAKGVFMVRAVAYPQDGVVRASFCKQPIAGTQQMLSHGWILGELGVGTDEHYVFSLVFLHNGIEIALASVLLVKLGVGHTHVILKRVVVTEIATFSCCEILFRA